MGGQMKTYTVVRELGRGATSRVYLAVDRRDGKKYAIKRYGSREHFQVADRELSLTKRLKHPGIPVVRESRAEGDGGMVVMEYVPGVTWKEHLRQRGALTEEEAVAWGMELSDIVAYMHRQEPAVIYRDLKPSNLMVTPAGHVKLIDFGAAVTGKNGVAWVAEPVGTKGFAAPEQFVRNGVIDTRTDIYAFGATMVQMMTGRHPAEKCGNWFQRRKGEISLSKKMEAVLGKCVAVQPDSRYRFFEEIKRDLENPEVPGASCRKLRITRSEMHS